MGEPVIQAMVWVVSVALGLAFLCQMRGDRGAAGALGTTALVGTLVGIGAMATLDIKGELEPTAPPPTVQVTITDAVVEQCLKDGGVQMAHLDGRWVCIAPEVAG